MQMNSYVNFEGELIKAGMEFDRIYKQEHAKAGIRFDDKIDYSDPNPLPNLSPESKRRIRSAHEKYEEAHQAYQRYLAERFSA